MSWAPRHHHQPRIEVREARPYVAIAARSEDLDGFRRAMVHGMPTVFRWVGERGLRPAGPPFVRYLVVDDDTIPVDHAPPPSTFEIAVPLDAPLGGGGDDLVRPGELPAGRWLTTLHRGGYGCLGSAHVVARSWADDEEEAIDRTTTDVGTSYAGCAEHYLRGPVDEPDPWRWETDVAYLLEPPG